VANPNIKKEEVINKNIRTAIIIGGVIVAILIIVPLVIGLVGGWQRYGYGMMEGFGWGWFMPIIMIVFWGLVIWGIVALVRGLSTGSGSSSTQEESALDVLKKRYARGEITREEYEEKKKDLL
jgi:putative membrane protein